jgi:hypothetical protein
MSDQTKKNQRPYGFWNWGTGIAITIIISASLMIFLVYKSMHVTFDMAEKDYYAEELKFDGKMKASENAKLLSTPLTINETEDFVVIQFPEECIGQKLQGTLVLYRPSAENKDVSLPMTPDNNGKIIVAKKNLLKGLYQLKANWEMNGKSYNVEKSFFVQLS